MEQLNGEHAFGWTEGLRLACDFWHLKKRNGWNLHSFSWMAKSFWILWAAKKIQRNPGLQAVPEVSACPIFAFFPKGVFLKLRPLDCSA